GFSHLVVQVVPFTGTLANAGEYRNTAMLMRNIMDQLLHQNGFTYARAAEQTDFTAFGIRRDQVDDLDAGFEDFSLCRELFKLWCITVNRIRDRTIHFPAVIDRLAKYV